MGFIQNVIDKANTPKVVGDDETTNDMLRSLRRQDRKLREEEEKKRLIESIRKRNSVSDREKRFGAKGILRRDPSLKDNGLFKANTFNRRYKKGIKLFG